MYHEVIRLSIGVASIKDSQDIHHLLNICDKHLYEAKRNGKHQIKF